MTWFAACAMLKDFFRFIYIEITKISEQTYLKGMSPKNYNLGKYKAQVECVLNFSAFYF